MSRSTSRRQPATAIPAQPTLRRSEQQLEEHGDHPAARLVVAKLETLMAERRLDICPHLKDTPAAAAVWRVNTDRFDCAVCALSRSLVTSPRCVHCGTTESPLGRINVRPPGQLVEIVGELCPSCFHALAATS